VDDTRRDSSDLTVDWVVIGSGFGGSVSALRLAEKGYSVLVLEQGRRWRDEDFAETTWEYGKAEWLPQLGLRGIMRISLFRHVNIISGVGVGGGSLTWANTSYVPHSDDFYRHPQWAGLADWRTTLAPHYATAQRMLGVCEPEFDGPSERLMRDLAADLGVPDSVRTPPQAVFFGEPGVEVDDPYFDGQGPRRTGCTRCGRCVIGCRVGAKNTLEKNYLWLAERLGVRIVPDRRVVDLRPLDDDGTAGWEVLHVATPPAKRPEPRIVRAGGVVLAGGTLGTNELLLTARERGSLTRLSDRLGHLVRTNSETITAATALDRDADYSADVTITASIFPDEHTHITNNTYADAGDGNSPLFAPLTGPGTRLTRPLRLLGVSLRHPRVTLRSLVPFGWSRRTVVFTTMQSVDSSIRLVLRRRRLGSGWVMDTAESTGDDAGAPVAFLPIANEVTALAAGRMRGYAQSSVLDVLRAVPSTAHILGGAVIGTGPQTGVVDAQQRVFGYRNLLVCDGSVVPINPGVNPGLTITALAEHAMSHLPGASEP
jgi:cholesterol oxidase